MTTQMTEKLTTKEFGRLVKLESVIKKGIGAAVETWIALEEIRDSRLYREKHKSFDQYCQEKWKMQRRYADMLIKSAAVVKSLPPEVRTMVLNPRQARALDKIPEAKRSEVVVNASKSGAVTAKAITKAAQEIDRPRITAGPEPVFDELGIKVPANAMPMWSRRNEVLAMMKDLSEIKTQIASSQKADDLLYIEVCNSTLADLSRCREGVSYALPYTVCPDCKGQTIDKCGLCKGRGVISKVLYQTVPAEVRAMREKGALKKK